MEETVVTDANFLQVLLTSPMTYIVLAIIVLALFKLWQLKRCFSQPRDLHFIPQIEIVCASRIPPTPSLTRVYVCTQLPDHVYLHSKLKSCFVMLRLGNIPLEKWIYMKMSKFVHFRAQRDLNGAEIKVTMTTERHKYT